MLENGRKLQYKTMILRIESIESYVLRNRYDLGNH